MNKDKLKNYNLTASIHTVGLKSKVDPVLPPNVDLDIIRASFMQKTKMHMVRVNPNKLHGDIFAYSEFNATMHQLCQAMRITPTYYRCDIRLDSYEYTFNVYYKLNLLLINLFSILFNDPNGQAVSHLLTCSKEFSDVSTKNQYWEVKYYDKARQSHDTDPAKARLEFRSLKSTKDGGHTPDEIKEMWFKKLDKLPELYEKLQEKSNDALYEAYLQYVEYNGKSGTKGDLVTSFLSNYINSISIFTRKQMRAFMVKCGVKEESVEERANYIINKVHIEFFSKSDLKNYIEKIKHAMDDYFLC